MSSFTVRVVLHKATSEHYDDLHDAMLNDHGALRQILGSSGVWYDLPDGEYNITADKTAGELRSGVMATAKKIKAVPRPSVLVTKAADRAWTLDEVPGDS